MATREQLIEDFADHKLATGEKFVNLINSMKVVQEPVEDPAASGTSLGFIDSISQDADGKITATKKTLDLANAHELNPFKGWYKTGDTLPTDGFDGAYLYFKDTSELTGQTTIYRWNGTAYADTGTVVDTSNVQTFETGQALNEVAIDGTGLKNPAANALAKAGDVMDLVAKLEGVTAVETKQTVADWHPEGESSGYYDSTGAWQDNNNYQSARFLLPEGVKRVRFIGFNKDFTQNYGYGFLDSDSERISGTFKEYYSPSNPATGKCELVVDVPDGAAFFVCLRTAWSSSTTYQMFQESEFYCYLQSGERVRDLIPDVEDTLTGDVEYLLPYNLLDVTKLESGKTISGTTGDVISTSTSNRAVTPFMRVIPGKKYYLYGGGYGTNGGVNHFGAVYDENKKFLRQVSLSSSDTSGKLFEAQEGDCFVRHTINTTAACEAFLPALADGSAPNINGVTNKAGNVQLPSFTEVRMAHTNSPLLIGADNAPFVRPSLSLMGDNRAVVKSEILAATTWLGISSLTERKYPEHMKGCHTISFKGFLTSLGENDYIRVGVNRVSSTGKTVKITSTGIVVERYDDGSYISCGVNVLHGLTIETFVMCEVTLHWNGGKVCLVSKGGSFVHEWTLQDFNENAQKYARENEGIASLISSVEMTNVELSQTSDRFMKPVWIFGDSYTSVYEYGDNGRWPYSMIYTYGVDGFLLDGYAGAESPAIYADLVKALEYGTPKYLVWCLGLNDATNAVVRYKNYAQQVENICKERGITLIYERLPYRFDQNLNFRNRIGDINSYIESSGYRYIDFFGAVASDAEGHWYSGMLKPVDNAHPTPLGAQVLAGQILADFPEIANYK